MDCEGQKMTLRPNLPNSLDEQLEKENIDGVPLYKVAGYTSKSAFVSQAVKEKIEKEKEKNREK